jgi:hypothetical protein
MARKCTTCASAPLLHCCSPLLATCAACRCRLCGCASVASSLTIAGCQGTFEGTLMKQAAG